MDPSRIPTATIPTFDGSNYIAWSTALRGVFRYSGAWNIVEGNPSGTTPAVALACPTTGAMEMAAWDEKIDKALGLMEIYLGEDYKNYVGARTVAAEV